MDSMRLDNVPRIAMFIGETSYLTPFIGSLYASLKSLGEDYTYAIGSGVASDPTCGVFVGVCSICTWIM